MALEKIYTELAELYHNSGKEFFAEVTALLENYFPAMEHTILGQNEEGDWKLFWGEKSYSDTAYNTEAENSRDLDH